MADVSANVNPQGLNIIQNIVDTGYSSFFVAWYEHTENSKRITINLGADYNIAMIFIINKINSLGQLVDFEIRVGKCMQRTEGAKEAICPGPPAKGAPPPQINNNKETRIKFIKYA